MTVVLIIDVLVVAGLVGITLTKGLEQALPFFAFVLVFVPRESKILLPGFFALTTWRVAIATLAILYLLCNHDTNQQKSVIASIPLKYLLVIDLIWCAISTANSVVPADSFKQLLATLVEYFLMYCIVIRTITSTRTINRILGAMVMAVGLACVAGVFEAYSSWRIVQWFPPAEHDFNFALATEGRGDRIISTFGNYSLFGAAIAFAIVQVFYFLQLKTRASRKLLLWATMILMFWVIYKTITRGPWLALIIGCCMVLLYCQAKTRRQLLLIVALCVAVCVIRPGVWDTIKNIAITTAATDDPDNIMAASYEYRWALWRVGADALAREPARALWGYGMSSFFDLHLTAPYLDNPAYVFESCDNAWVQQMVETGYVGLFLLAVVLMTSALRILRYVTRLPKPESYLCWFLFINMVQYYFMMTNVAIYGWGQTGYMLWMWIAMAMICPALQQVEGRAESANSVQPVELEQQWVASTA